MGGDRPAVTNRHGVVHCLVPPVAPPGPMTSHLFTTYQNLEGNQLLVFVCDYGLHPALSSSLGCRGLALLPIVFTLFFQITQQWPQL